MMIYTNIFQLHDPYFWRISWSDWIQSYLEQQCLFLSDPNISHPHSRIWHCSLNTCSVLYRLSPSSPALQPGLVSRSTPLRQSPYGHRLCDFNPVMTNFGHGSGRNVNDMIYMTDWFKKGFTYFWNIFIDKAFASFEICGIWSIRSNLFKYRPMGAGRTCRWPCSVRR